MRAFSASLGPDDDPLELTNADLAALLRNNGNTILGPVARDRGYGRDRPSASIGTGRSILAQTLPIRSWRKRLRRRAGVRVVSAPETYTLSVGVSGDGNVTPSGGTYVAGEEVMFDCNARFRVAFRRMVGRSERIG